MDLCGLEAVIWLSPSKNRKVNHGSVVLLTCDTNG
jgi:hypothetical protein